MKIKWLIFFLVVAVGALAWPQLPDMIPSHWNSAGEIDGYATKWIMWLMPAVMLGTLLLFRVLPKIDPKKINYKRFTSEYEWIQVALISFFSYFFLLQILAGLNEDFAADYFSRLLFGGMGVMFILLGSPMRTLKQNFFVGIRTPWTLTNAKSWKKTHEMGGRLFIAMGGFFILGALLNWQLIWPIIITILAIVAFLFVYSYYVAKGK